jgi:ATP-dependent exoDNAse (exonuclease V) beta subunit
MSSIDSATLPDKAAREEALDTTRSFLVQAPAGSGKTELLSMRVLKLLAQVAEPEQVLAITFTKAATAEMQHRILAKLGVAKECIERRAIPFGDDRVNIEIAIAALENSHRRGWRLLEQPQRLNIQTIDSLCLRIAHRMPLAARLSGTLEPVENALPLYRQAARNTMDRLGGQDIELNRALRSLLLLRDSNLANLEDLLMGMLQTRDQWATAFPLSGDVDWDQAKARLERPFRDECGRVLSEAHTLFSNHPGIASELMELATYACLTAEPEMGIGALADTTSIPSAGSLEEWRCITNLLLTKDGGGWLRSANKRHGFPPGEPKASFEAEQKRRRKRLMNDLESIPGLFELLRAIRQLPAPGYSDEQWTVLRDIFIALRQAVHELSIVFADQAAVDFVELGRAAHELLSHERDETSPQAQHIQHLLVDEFQDTSRRQHALIAALLRDWSGGDGRTLFLVGDPMQSIYSFREADVELFDLVRKQGFVTARGTITLGTLQLTTNFRSTEGIVDHLNEIFSIIFPHKARPDAAAVDFLPGIAVNRDSSPRPYQVHPDFIQAEPKADPDNPRSHYESSPAIQAQKRETAEIIQVIRRHLPAIERAQSTNHEFTVAVLVRAKEHVADLAGVLRDEGIPFRAVELEKLEDRQEILDLQSLTRAVQHPMDRIAWLSVLRAPWCGLTLRDLHILCGTDDPASGIDSVLQQAAKQLHLLDAEASERASHLVNVMQSALQRRYMQSSFTSFIERTWRSLGGPACVDATGYENALTYFRMLEDVAPDGIAATGEAMRDSLSRLFAQPDPSVSDRCGLQLMTMHKAKGLGFDVVLVPGLHRRSGTDSPQLIRYLQKSTASGIEMFVAPIGSKGEDESALNKWVRRQRNNREFEERKRLLYVACTRARSEVHLLGTVSVTKKGLEPQSGTLLQSAWPAIQQIYQQETPSQPEALIEFPSTPRQTFSSAGILSTLAAAEDSSTLRRLPSDWRFEAKYNNVTVPVTNRSGADATMHPRPNASHTSRVLGTVVHSLFEQASRRLDQGEYPEGLRLSLQRAQLQAVAIARNEGLTPAAAESTAERAVTALQFALDDDYGLWILKPHAGSYSESSWTGMLGELPQTLRFDRVFRAGDKPLSEGTSCLWIVDYKTTTHSGPDFASFLSAQRELYREQLEKYARLMGLAHGGELKIRLALYYPLIQQFDWWKPAT